MEDLAEHVTELFSNVVFELKRTRFDFHPDGWHHGKPGFGFPPRRRWRVGGLSDRQRRARRLAGRRTKYVHRPRVKRSPTKVKPRCACGQPKVGRLYCPACKAAAADRARAKQAAYFAEWQARARDARNAYQRERKRAAARAKYIQYTIRAHEPIRDRESSVES